MVFFMRQSSFFVRAWLLGVLLVSLSGSAAAQQGSWRSVGSTSYAVKMGTGFGIGNKGYFVTGVYNNNNNYPSDVNIYNQPIRVMYEDTHSIAPVPERSGAVSFSLNGKGYLGTGQRTSTGTGTGTTYYNDFWEYDPDTRVWTQKNNFPGPARSGAVAFSLNGKAYLGTGAKGATYYKDFWEYDPATDTWTQKSDFAGTARSRATGFSLNGKGYLGTGQGTSTSPSTGTDFWEYDPAADAWTKKTNYPGSGRRGLAGFSVNGKGYLGTGSASLGNTIYYRDFWEFDPSAQGSWKQMSALPTMAQPRDGAIAFSLGGEGVLGTGAADSNSSALTDVYTFTPPPTIVSIGPNPGGLGQAITLTGFGLGSPTALTINGVDALANIVSNDGASLVVRVPLGAAAAGNVSITTANGTATLPFSLMAAPGNALAFDGVNDYLALPTSTPVPTGNGAYTLEAWMKPTAMGVAGIIGWGNWGTTNQVNALRLSPTGIINYWWGPDLSVTTPNLSGRWHHVAATFDGTTRTIYLDGVALGSDTPGTHTVPTPSNLRIGCTNGPSPGGGYEYFNGSIDEVRVYSVALTPAQVQADMVSTTAAVPASLVLYYNLDQGTPATASTGANAPYTTLYDLSSTATAATLMGFDLSSGNTSSNYVASDALVVPTATAATSQTSTSFIATWTAPATGTVTGYLLDVSSAADFSQPVAGSPFTAAASATSYGVTGLAPSTTYSYRVRALNSNLTPADQGAYSLAVAATTAGPLPVTLVAFTAQAEGPAAVRLRWTTASELDNAGFTVERSLDGRTFQAVGSLPGVGSSASAHAYSLLDGHLPAGATLLYYRLRQTDRDGTAHYAPLRTVALSAAVAGFVVYPTRVGSGQAASYRYTGPAGAGTLLVLDMLGRPLRTLPVDGSAQGEVPLAGLVTGAYLLRYTTATASFTSRCLVE